MKSYLVHTITTAG